MAEIIDIPEGRKNDYLVHGVFAIIAAGILLLAHWALTVLLVAIAVALFSVSSGIEIDLHGRKARVYKSIGRLRLGSWLAVDRYNSVAIRYTNESQTMGGRGPELTVRVRTYDLHLTGPDGASELFHDFTDYAKARKCAVTMAKGWALNLTDEVQERRERAQANAENRRR